MRADTLQTTVLMMTIFGSICGHIEAAGEGGRRMPLTKGKREKSPLTMNVNKEDVVCQSLLGFGAEWDPYYYTGHGVTEGDFKTIARRVQWMRMPVARIMMLTRWCYQGKGQFDFETREMKDLYRHLDVCEKVGSTVFLTDWGIQRSWLFAHEIRDVTDPKYAEAIGKYLDHLVNVRKYKCIKYFIFGNEPNWEVRDFQKWKRGYLNLHKELTKRGLLKQVKLVGADAGMPQGRRERKIVEQWFIPSVNELKNIASSYDFHRYAMRSAVRSGKLERLVSRLRNYTLKHDPKAGGKPLIVGEAGMKDGSRPPAFSANTPKFEYGLFMADYAVQAINGGAGSVMAWMLDDNSHKGFTWGMWENKPKGLGLKPWFYPWSLLCRYFPTGSRVLKSGLSSPDVRALSARCKGPASKKEGWTFCIVNRSGTPQNIEARVEGGSPVSMRRYVYCKTSRNADKDGFPVPVDTKTYDLGTGTSIPCPAQSVTVLTSLE